MKHLINSFTKHCVTLLALGILWMGFGPTLTHAATKETTYPSSSCQSMTRADRDLLTYFGNAVVSWNGELAHVFCPIPKTVSNGALSTVVVRVLDSNPTKKVACSLSISDAGSNPFDGNGLLYLKGSSTFQDSGMIFFTNIKFDTSSGLYVYDLYCNFDPVDVGDSAVGLLSYTVWETDIVSSPALEKPLW